MAKSALRETSGIEGGFVDPFAVWSAGLDVSQRMQQLQWQALAACQDSLVTLSKDFWEQWACRYAGGAPIDA